MLLLSYQKSVCCLFGVEGLNELLRLSKSGWIFKRVLRIQKYKKFGGNQWLRELHDLRISVSLHQAKDYLAKNSGSLYSLGTCPHTFGLFLHCLFVGDISWHHFTTRWPAGELGSIAGNRAKSTTEHRRHRPDYEALQLSRYFFNTWIDVTQTFNTFDCLKMT